MIQRSLAILKIFSNLALGNLTSLHNGNRHKIKDMPMDGVGAALTPIPAYVVVRAISTIGRSEYNPVIWGHGRKMSRFGFL